MLTKANCRTKFLCVLIPVIAGPCTVFSQTIPVNKLLYGRRVNERHAANYYLHKKNPYPRFSIQYNSLFSGLQNYAKRDTATATKLIRRLYKLNDILFFRLMRIRLQWEFKQRHVRSSLDSIRPLIRNNIDSAKYHYMLALYFRDSLNERIARGLGYVRATYNGDEVVDWRKLKYLKWRNPRVIETIGSDPLIIPPQEHGRIKSFGTRDSLIFLYKMAIEDYYYLAVDEDPKEFHYLRELIAFLYNQPENRDQEIREIINSKHSNYTDKEQEALKELVLHLDMSKNLYGPYE